MQHAYNALDLIGRILLAWFFIPSGIEKITGYAGMAAYMTAHGVPSFLLPVVIVLEIVGGLMVLFGWRTRIAGFLLGGFSIIAVLIFWLHPADQIGQIVRAAELAVAGGLWVLAAHGARGWSLDAVFDRRRTQRGGQQGRVSAAG